MIYGTENEEMEARNKTMQSNRSFNGVSDA
jgi:hypothetical protein